MYFLFSVAIINLRSILFRTLSVIIIQSLYSIDEIIKYYFRQFIVATMDFLFSQYFLSVSKILFSCPHCLIIIWNFLEVVVGEKWWLIQSFHPSHCCYFALAPWCCCCPWWKQLKTCISSKFWTENYGLWWHVPYKELKSGIGILCIMLLSKVYVGN